ncbi:MAG TPA: outer membrane beta-barrel protein, partial [Terriglobia bacterium]|nr:outer membrane beta-barrel protein [Terriglobia bacterium]
MRKNGWVAYVVLILLFLCSSTLMGQEKWELGGYGGGSWFSKPNVKTSYPQPNSQLVYNFAPGGVLGVRVRENLTDHFGLEQSFTFLGTNNARATEGAVGIRHRQAYFNAILWGYGVEDRVRPYFSGGGGWTGFHPTDDAKKQFPDIANFLSSSNVFTFNVGGGLKIKLTEHAALDFSLRDFINKAPSLGFPDADRKWIHNMQPQGGLMVLWGGAPPIVHTFTVGPGIEASKTSLCPGETATLRINASDSIATAKITYKWTVKGQEVGSGPEYTFTAPGQAGTYDVAVHVFYDTAGMTKRELKAVKKNPGTAADRTTTITVKETPPPQVTASVDRSTVQRGERVRLIGNATAGECCGTMSYRWTVNQGQILSGADQATAELDTSGLSFSDSMQGQQQQKIVATLEVTTEKCGKGTARTGEITVGYSAPLPPAAPKAMQLADVNFAPNSSRVNNCGKRLLANELYPQMTDARYRDYDIVLIGHQDEKEKAKVPGKKDTTLDRERV